LGLLQPVLLPVAAASGQAAEMTGLANHPLPLAAIGLLMLMAGGHLVVREAATLDARIGVTALVIGVVIVGFGTSAPEMATAVRAATSGAPALGFGNALGASLANLLLVLPLAALLNPITVARAAIWREGAAVTLAAVLFAGLAWLPGLAQAGGGAMLVLLASWLLYSLRRPTGRQPSAEALLQQQEGAALVGPAQPWWQALILLAVGIILLVAGADLLVNAAMRYARQIGIAEDVLGLTLLSFGTCLPELTTAILAARRQQTDIVVGNVLGSCLFNMLGVGGLVQLLAASGPEGLARSIDAPALVLATLLVMALLVGRQRLDRLSASLLLPAYAAWLSLRLLA
jgi:cation:H+ antiporter